MAATVKPIEAKSIHQIQSGQVIVDLCSVVKELVENGLDAGANTIEVRFKNNGLDEVEVQDNGSGINPANYEGVALKHYTSKLSTYDDLDKLSTFGFRGEALSSLCALSTFSIATAQASEAPRGTRLEFEASGKLRATSVVACQKGTTATVSDLFRTLPVRKKELSKNIKREYGKVLGLLHAYACIAIDVKYTVKNTMPKGKSTVVFATHMNASTRDNIANIYGAKTLPALAPLNLEFNVTSSEGILQAGNWMKVQVQGHISKPVFGEGRSTPDRQMFFVNGRPCGLPQIAKAINEVYKSFNVSQSPFVLANLLLDTNSYDVNVSPDKRSILLHNAAALTDELRDALTAMFEKADQTVPYVHASSSKLSRSSTVEQPTRSTYVPAIHNDHEKSPASSASLAVANDTASVVSGGTLENELTTSEKQRQPSLVSESSNSSSTSPLRAQKRQAGKAIQNLDDQSSEPEIPATLPYLSRSSPGLVQSTFDRTRPRRPEPELATVTIGDRTVTRILGAPRTDSHRNIALSIGQLESTLSQDRGSDEPQRFSRRLAQFSAETHPVDASQSSLDSDHQKSQTITRKSRINDDEPGTVDASADRGDYEEQPGEMNSDEEDGSSKGNETDEADRDYVDDGEKKAKEDLRVQELIQRAEQAAQKPSASVEKRTKMALKENQSKDSTNSLETKVDFSIGDILSNATNLTARSKRMNQRSQIKTSGEGPNGQSGEEVLALTVSKTDFAFMHIVGQFNLGFILTTRPSRRREDSDEGEGDTRDDELFIIDQHASDEKCNFERLQTETVVSNQRLVRPIRLNLTAVEEEIIMDNFEALEKNGFVVSIDESGHAPVGHRCELLCLPLSKEVTFTVKDFEELVYLLSESSVSQSTRAIPRPSKVRKMFAMRACRSSIMIGKTLSQRQMRDVVSHMGSIDKPWNCPHGRPTMRHLASLDSFQEVVWQEGSDELDATMWKAFVAT